MTQASSSPGPADPAEPADSVDPVDPADPVGTVSEEAAKLFSALSDWARDHAGGTAGEARHAGEAIADWVSGHAERGSAGATDGGGLGPDCRYCPVCQVIHAVRNTSPEVRQHLAIAVSSMVQAMAGLMQPPTPRAEDPGVERITLDDDQDAEDAGGARP